MAENKAVAQLVALIITLGILMMIFALRSLSKGCDFANIEGNSTTQYLSLLGILATVLISDYVYVVWDTKDVLTKKIVLALIGFSFSSIITGFSAGLSGACAKEHGNSFAFGILGGLITGISLLASFSILDEMV